ncbi:hypothetical protein BV133_1243 [Blastochloris viridis]|uniref:Murein endopeptidase K n=1 Tax=Blastochloris viridis TaxID=1079 RepID=A0A0H5BEQ5_BLAVI|nr:hypothetical protein BV133_1243 [Blastochloris viridis]CUU43835.1 hypothetical protein BVIRIDIS_28620 [Blastochloris viridis]
MRYLSRSTFFRHGRNGLFCLTLAAAAVVFGVRGTQDAIANGDTRTLSFHHTHTGESITLTYKRDGRYDDDALKKLNWFMRDWRRQEMIKMDPHLFDVVWEVYRDVDARAPVEVVCGYRAPATNSMLRSRSRGVAQFSQHTVGKAIDLFIPGVGLSAIREAGLRLQRGGVGFYPSSGSPFVHLDTASVRHWPRMTRDQLARVFPDGKTVHLPADGRPMPGYEVAARQLDQRGGASRGRTVLASRDGPDVEELTDDGRALFRSSGASANAAAAAPRRSVFAWLGGDSSDERQSARAPQAPATAEPPKPIQLAQANVPLPPARPSGMPLPLTAASSPAAAVSVRPFESTISVAQAGAPGNFAEAPRPVTQPASAMRWVSGPAGVAPAPQDTSADAPLPPSRPVRAPNDGFALASASSRPAGDLTAGVSRGLPALITNGDEPAADSTPALAYASENALPRPLPAAASTAPSRVASAAPTTAAPSRRDPAPRLTAPRTEGPGLPRLITTARLGNAAVDLRHPDTKTAAALLRGSHGALDVRFSRDPAELAADHFAGPAILALPIARFEVAALGGADGKRSTH